MFASRAIDALPKTSPFEIRHVENFVPHTREEAMLQLRVGRVPRTICIEMRGTIHLYGNGPIISCTQPGQARLHGSCIHVHGWVWMSVCVPMRVCRCTSVPMHAHTAEQTDAGTDAALQIGRHPTQLSHADDAPSREKGKERERTKTPLRGTERPSRDEEAASHPSAPSATERPDTEALYGCTARHTRALQHSGQSTSEAVRL